MDGSLTWGKIEQAQPRALSTTMYSDAVSKLATNEVLMLRVEQIVPGTIQARRRICYPHRRIFACWIPDVEKYNQILPQVKANNCQILGFYAIDKDKLLRILLSE